MTTKQEIQELVAEKLLSDIKQMAETLETYKTRAKVYSESHRAIAKELTKLGQACERLKLQLVIRPDNGLPSDAPNYISYLAK